MGGFPFDSLQGGGQIKMDDRKRSWYPNSSLSTGGPSYRFFVGVLNLKEKLPLHPESLGGNFKNRNELLQLGRKGACLQKASCQKDLMFLTLLSSRRPSKTINQVLGPQSVISFNKHAMWANYERSPKAWRRAPVPGKGTVKIWSIRGLHAFGPR